MMSFYAQERWQSAWPKAEAFGYRLTVKVRHVDVIPNKASYEPFNTAVRKGTAGETVQRTVAEMKRIGRHYATGRTYRLSAKRRGASQFADARRSSSDGGPVEDGVALFVDSQAF